LVGEDGKAIYDEEGFRDTWCSSDLLSALKGVHWFGGTSASFTPGPGLRPITPIPNRGLGVMDSLH